MNIKLILGASILLLVSVQVNAAIVERDLLSSCDGLLTYDIMSGLFSETDSSGTASQGNIKEQTVGSTADQAGANESVYLARIGSLQTLFHSPQPSGYSVQL